MAADLGEGRDEGTTPRAGTPKAAKAVLFFVGGLWLWIGALAFLQPGDVAALVELGMETPMAKLEVRAYYGALALGIGALHVQSAVGDRWWPAGLYGSSVIMGSLALGRLASIAMDGDVGTLAWTLIVVEATCSAVAGLTLRWCRRAGL